jgi:hypothetical protein
MTRRRWLLLGGLIVATLAVAAGIAFLAFRDQARPVTAAYVADLSPGAELYVYDTTGYQEVTALGGARHDYPAETYLTVTPGGCGSLVRWQALRERWWERDMCPGNPSPVGYQDYNEWFGRAELGVFGCTLAGGAPSFEVGSTWSIECTSTDTAELFRFMVTAAETLVVGGGAVDTVHIRIVSETSGKTEGASSVEEWVRPEDGMLIKRTIVDNSTTSSQIGDVAYHEEAEIMLRSLRPAETG